MGRLRVCVLGSPRVWHGDVTLTFPTRKALALVLYLAVEGGLHSREKLAALFWPDLDQQHGRAMLRYTLASLRRALADGEGVTHLLVEREALGLDVTSGIELDVAGLPVGQALTRATVGELRQVADRCRGEPLEGFSVGDAPGFDDWAAFQREVWRRTAALVFDRLSHVESDGGDHPAALGTLQRWLTVDALNEDAHQRLIRLHLATGDRPAALRAYEACRALLLRELQVAPSPETESLAESIRTGLSSRMAGVPTRRAPTRESGADPAPPVLHEGPLVGRSNELTRLVEQYHAAVQGQTQVVVLRGEPGIGKTRLAAEFLDWAVTAGADVLHGRAFEAGGRLPYQPLVDALRPRLEHENAPEDLLSDVWLAELCRLLPELRERYPDLPAVAEDEAAARTRLFEAVTRLGEAMTHRSPVVLFVDDVQWADAGSLDVLRYAGRRWTDGRASLLLLLNLRPEALAATPALNEWLVGLRRDVTLTQIELGPLTAGDTLRFVQALATSAQRTEQENFAEWLHAETGGQPLFVVETIRSLLEREVLVPRPTSGPAGPGRNGGWVIDLPAGLTEGATIGGVLPPGVQDVIQARLARLATPARELLVAGAVLGQGFTFEQLCQVAELREDEALTAIDEVLRTHLLREAVRPASATAGGYLFSHDKIREVVYAAAGDARRRVFHRRALATLAGAPAAQLVRHALAAGLDEPAVQLGRAAGDEAMRMLTARDAITHYGRAIETAERLGWRDPIVELRARRGKAFASLSRWLEARPDLEFALAGLALGQAERRAEVMVDLLEVCWWNLDLPSLSRYATEALSLAERFNRGDLQTAALSWLAPTVSSDGDLLGCIAQAERAFTRGRQLGFAPPPAVVAYMAHPYYFLGRLEESVACGVESVQMARDASHTSATMFALPNLGLSLASSGRYAEAARTFDEARRFGREHGITTLLARAISMSAGYHLDLFDFAGNEAVAQEARELARSYSFIPPAVSSGIDLMLNYSRRHEVGLAENLIPEVEEAVAKTIGWHHWLWTIRLNQARAELALVRRDFDGAIRLADIAIEESRLRQRVKYNVLALVTRAEAMHGIGRTRSAIDDLRSAVALARPVGDPTLFLRASTGLLALDGDDALAAEGTSAVQRITAGLTDERLRYCFEVGHAVARAGRPSA
jgi:DNA-binding SARP family transcriptional activator/tetratricopeptide (TPR) repeat protein